MKRRPTRLRENTSSDVGTIFRAFDKLADLLNLSLTARLNLLGGISASTYRRRMISRALEFRSDEERRLALFFSIFERAGGVFGDAPRWLLSDHRAPLFGGKPPMTLLQDGSLESLEWTYEHLRDVDGGWA